VFVFEELINLMSGKSDQGYGNRKSIVIPIIPNYALIDKKNNYIRRTLFEYSSKFNGVERSSKNRRFLKYIHIRWHLRSMDFLKKYPHIKLVEDKDTAETEESRKTVERNCSNRQ
jgi:prephenate dehydratase